MRNIEIITLWVVWIALLFFTPFQGKTQDNLQHYGIQRISTEIQRNESGISQSSVRYIFEDHKGLLWLGTWDGLNRYDGIRVHILREEVANETGGLSNSTVNCINQDSQNNMWIGTDGGINCIDYMQMVRKPLRLKSSNPLLTDTIHDIFIDGQDRIWLGAQKGLCVLNAGRDSLKYLSELLGFTTELDHLEIRKIHSFKANEIWVGTNKGLFLVNTKKRTIKSWKAPRISDASITTLCNFNDSLLFIGTENGLSLLRFSDHQSETFFPFENLKTNFGNNVILSCTRHTDNNILFCVSGKGLILFDAKIHKFERFRLPKLDEFSIDDFNPQEEDVMSFHRDNYDNIWLGTAWNGLVRISPQPVLFSIYRKNQDANQGLNDNHIWCFLSEEDKVWIGTENGLNIYHLQSLNTIYINTLNGLESNKIRCISKDKYGRIWVGTNDAGLSIIDTDGHIRNFKQTDANPIILNNTIWHFMEDLRGNMWVSTYGGLAKISLDSLQATFYTQNSNDTNSLSSSTVYSTLLDTKGKIWISTYYGLNYFDPINETFIRYLRSDSDTNTLSTNKIFSTYDDGNGQLWIATMGGGLNKMDLVTGKITWFTTENGLPNNVIYSLIDDGLGFLWISTNSGICRFNMTTQIANSYSVSDGLQSNEFNYGAAYLSPKDNIFMGGMKGFNVFNPKTIHESNVNSPITISWVNSLNSGKYYDINFGDTLVLGYDHNFFDIAYTKLNLKQAMKDVFRHRLLTYDPDWVIDHIGSAQASYSNLKPGTYRFQVQSATVDGIWEKQSHDLIIVVEEVWYASMWFRSLLLGTFVLFALLIVRIRIRRIKRNAYMQSQIHQLEKQALRLQMNPHFVFNTLNSIQSYILNNNTEESISYLSKFSKLMRSILNNSSESIVPLFNEIEILHQYIQLEQLRFNHCFTFNVKTPKNIDVEFIGIPAMLIQPYVENAIIHGVAPLKERSGIIQLSFSLEQKYLICIIEDNGVGRGFHHSKAKSLHKPKGMLISQKRLEILNNDFGDTIPIQIEDLMDANGKPIGTKVKLKILYEDLND